MPSPIAPARSAPSPYGPSTTEPAVYPPREQGFAAPHGYVVASESAGIAHPHPSSRSLSRMLRRDGRSCRRPSCACFWRLPRAWERTLVTHRSSCRSMVAEITVSSAGIALGEVPGSWDGEQRVSADARAADLLACLDDDAANGQQSIVDLLCGAAPRLVIRHEEGDDGGCDVPLSAPTGLNDDQIQMPLRYMPQRIGVQHAERRDPASGEAEQNAQGSRRPRRLRNGRRPGIRSF